MLLKVKKVVRECDQCDVCYGLHFNGEYTNFLPTFMLGYY